MFDLAGGLTKSGTWRNHAPLAVAYRARLSLVRTIVKPLAYMTNVLLVKNGIKKVV